MKKYFQFDKHGTSYKNEILGGITTFLSMAYILAVNPQILSLAGVKGATSDMKMDQGAIFVATALAAFVGSLFMGLIAKYPIALAPGMGLNAFFAFTVVLTMGIPWQVGLTGVLFSGIFFALLTVTGLREVIINAIPHQMKLAVSAGIGLFITFVGLQSSGIIIKSDSTLVKLGHLTEAPVLLAIFWNHCYGHFICYENSWFNFYRNDCNCRSGYANWSNSSTIRNNWRSSKYQANLWCGI